MTWWAWPAILLCTAAIEVGWVLAVRIVGTSQVWRLVLVSVGMQGLSYSNTLIAVSDHASVIPGMLGAGLGAFVGLRVPPSWLRRSDPTGP